MGSRRRERRWALRRVHCGLASPRRTDRRSEFLGPVDRAVRERWWRGAFPATVARWRHWLPEDLKVLPLTTLLAALALPGPTEPSCWEIRLYVAIYGEEKAVRWAKNHGFSQS